MGFHTLEMREFFLKGTMKQMGVFFPTTWLEEIHIGKKTLVKVTKSEEGVCIIKKFYNTGVSKEQWITYSTD